MARADDLIRQLSAAVDAIELREVIASLTPQCATTGCKLREAQAILTQAERLVGKNSRGEIVSQALWCDQGDHAFSARDPKAEHWERQATDPDSGKKVTVPWDVCGQHMQAINGRLAQIEAEVTSRHDPAGD